MNDFERKLKEIIEIDDSWKVKSFYGQTTYYTFLNKTCCVSKCEYNNALKSYVFSKKDEILYSGYDEKEVLKCIKKVVNKSKK